MTRRLLALARDNRITLAVIIIFGFLSGLLTIGQAAGFSRVVAGIFLGGKLLPEFAVLLKILILVVLLRALLVWGSEVSASALAVRVKSDLRQRLFEKILHLGPAYTHGERTGELVNAAHEGIEALDAYFSQYLPQLVIATLVPLSILGFVFSRDPLSGLVLLLTAPLIPVFMYLIGKTAEVLTRRQWDTLGRLSAYFLDSLQGLTTLKELGRSRDHATSITAASNLFRDRTLSVLRVTFLSALVLELVGTVSTALVAVEVSLRLLYGHMAFEQAFFLLLLAPEFYLPLRMLGLRFHAGMSGTTAAQRIFEILDLPESGEWRTGSGDQDLRPVVFPVSRIAFENLSYTYPGEMKPVIQNISMHILSGEHVALVGSSGAGKSTLAALLLQFIQPDLGQITLDHELLEAFSIDSWRRMIAWVPQDPYLFHDTISANMLLAKPDATSGQIIAALQAAQLEEFIRSLPLGLETVVGEEGARLSSGQAQRLVLARAFLKNAPILVLDETTSSLDPEQERLVETTIHALMQGRTVVTIAHRLNTVFQADRIFVLENGRLVEQGKHSELLALAGVYASLVNSLPGIDIDPANVPSDPRTSTFENMLPTVSRSPIADHPSSTFLRLLGFLRGSWALITFSVLLGALTVGSNVGLMGTSAFLISSAALHPDLGALQVAIVGVRFFGISRGVFRYAERLVTHTVTFHVLARLRVWFFNALEPLAPARLMEYRAGDILSRIVSDVEMLENFYVRVVAPPMVAGFVAVGMAVFLGSVDFSLVWVYLVINLALGVGIPLLSWILDRHLGKELVSRSSALKASMVDGIQGLADLLAFGRELDYSASLLAQGRAYGRTQQRLAFHIGLSSGLTVLLVNLGMLVILVLAVPLVIMGQVSGVMLAVLSLSAFAGFEAVLPLPHAAQTLSSSSQSARRLFELVDATSLVKEPLSLDRLSPFPSQVRELGDIKYNYDLIIRGLTFTYPGNSRPALQDITFQLMQGKRIAIVGPSGVGKSTLFYLLLRFWDYSQGRIMIAGHDLHDYLQEDVRRLLSVIDQQTYFFNDTIRQNLVLARPDATGSEIQAAAQQAQIHDFIMGLPDGYETIIGERGVRFSGGERQRLAIARALLKKTPIILSDEPTANLDPLTERLIIDTLFTLTNGQSLLHITHRLVGLERMDEIILLDRGRLVERGTHADLLAAGGLYQRLWDQQNRILSS